MSLPIYFHELTDDQWHAMKYNRAELLPLTWEDIAARYSRPAWCNLTTALHGTTGCTALMARKVTGDAYCVGCDYHGGEIA